MSAEIVEEETRGHQVCHPRDHWHPQEEDLLPHGHVEGDALQVEAVNVGRGAVDSAGQLEIGERDQSFLR